MMNAVGKWLENNKTPGRKVGANFFLILSQINCACPGEAD